MKSYEQEEPERELNREIGMVVCPHYQGCKYGATKSTKARHRCYGNLYRISNWESGIVIAFKCKLAGKRMLIEIKGSKIRHIPADSTDYEAILPRLQILTCKNCGKRVLDYFAVYGETIVEAKCNHDGHPDVYPVK
jgi:hypothetical protein